MAELAAERSNARATDLAQSDGAAAIAAAAAAVEALLRAAAERPAGDAMMAPALDLKMRLLEARAAEVDVLLARAPEDMAAAATRMEAALELAEADVQKLRTLASSGWRPASRRWTTRSVVTVRWRARRWIWRRPIRPAGRGRYSPTRPKK